MSLAPTILVIDDEPQIRKFLRISLASQGFKVLEAENAGQGLGMSATLQPDLIVLDLGLPDQDGQEVLSNLREWTETPVLVLSARAGEDQKVTALDAGANDYMVKPFGIQEFLARVRRLLRQSSCPVDSKAVVNLGNLSVDLAARVVTLDGQRMALTPKEYAVLSKLAQHPGRVITQRQLLVDIWGGSHREDTHYLRIVIGHLRQKLGDDSAAPRYLHTEAGVGYRLDFTL